MNTHELCFAFFFFFFFFHILNAQFAAHIEWEKNRQTDRVAPEWYEYVCVCLSVSDVSFVNFAHIDWEGCAQHCWLNCLVRLLSCLLAWLPPPPASPPPSFSFSHPFLIFTQWISSPTSCHSQERERERHYELLLPSVLVYTHTHTFTHIWPSAQESSANTHMHTSLVTLLVFTLITKWETPLCMWHILWFLLCFLPYLTIISALFVFVRFHFENERERKGCFCNG